MIEIKLECIKINNKMTLISNMHYIYQLVHKHNNKKNKKLIAFRLFFFSQKTKKQNKFLPATSTKSPGTNSLALIRCAAPGLF